jgi:hypothetical protein
MHLACGVQTVCISTIGEAGHRGHETHGATEDRAYADSHIIVSCSCAATHKISSPENEKSTQCCI